MSQNAPALLQSAERLLLAIEKAVRSFPRYHKYTLGTELRAAAIKLAQLAQRAWRDVNGRALHFLGYVIRPTHTLVRPRVVQHLRNTLQGFERAHVDGAQVVATPAAIEAVRARYASYEGHLRHASSHRLTRQLHRRHPWLHATTGVRRRFHHSLQHHPLEISFAVDDGPCAGLRLWAAERELSERPA